MDTKKLVQAVKRIGNAVSSWLAWPPAIIVGVGYVSKFFKWGIKGPFPFLRENILYFWLLAIVAILAVLWIRISRIHGRFLSGFKDDFRGDLNDNWDFRGKWRITEKGTLLVTQSGDGGLSKLGTYWENYTFTFKAFIQNICLGAIVRAHGLDNYYMLQITKKRIRPHQRIAVPVFEKESQSRPEIEYISEGVLELQPLKHALGWYVFDGIAVDLNRPLEDWFDVRITVRGQSIFLYINDELVFQQDSFLMIPTGKVGFRNSGAESALVRNVRVTLHP